MEFNNEYKKQVELLVDILPQLNDTPCFGLKGGTAINLFIRDMPRLSIDIDLAYLPIEDRQASLDNITSALLRLKDSILIKERDSFKVDNIINKQNQLSKLVIHSKNASIKIEPNFTIRGHVFECVNKKLCAKPQNEFLAAFQVKCLSDADIYAGKICAALNRQHPRVLFDIKMLFEHGGITKSIQQAFIAYLVPDARPMSELLLPNLIDISAIFENEFSGMTDRKVSLNELITVRADLIKFINHALTENERKFLISIKRGEPEWDLLDIDIQHLPAIQWKLLNVRKMDKRKHVMATDKLKSTLGI